MGWGPGGPCPHPHGGQCMCVLCRGTCLQTNESCVEKVFLRQYTLFVLFCSQNCCLWPICLLERLAFPRGTLHRSQLGVARLKLHASTHYSTYPFNKYLRSKFLCLAPLSPGMASAMRKDNWVTALKKLRVSKC